MQQAFVQFELERWMATWEGRVRHNLCDSGVHPLTTAELLALAGADPAEALGVRLAYGQANGSDALRAAVARRYAGADPGQVLVTTGSAEALFLLCWTLLRPGLRVVVPGPTYFQVPGLVRNAGAELVSVPFRAEAAWQLDLDAFDAAVTPGTAMVLLANPNNPTGRALSAGERAAVTACAARAGAWLVVDEMYHGAELDGRRTPTFWGGYERTVVTSGISKAYGLPGLRLGWLAGPPGLVRDLWWRHDYTVLAPNPLADWLAGRALAAEAPILERTRSILSGNYARLAARLDRLGRGLAWLRPDAGGICLVRYPDGPDSRALAERLRDRHGVLVAPGDHFGAPRSLRVGIGGDPATYPGALDALVEGLGDLL
jgi:aspartate/methionine/tyrosine aminotransferase